MSCQLKETHTHLFKLLVGHVHELAGAQHLEQLGAEVAGDGLHQPQRPLDGVLGVADLLQVGEDGHQRLADLVQLRGRQQVVEREVLHQGVVVVHRLHRLLQACGREERKVCDLISRRLFRTRVGSSSCTESDRRHTGSEHARREFVGNIYIPSAHTILVGC